MDLLAYLADFDKERYRVVVIHTMPEHSSHLSQFCQKICQRANGKYLDCLNLFIQSDDLKSNIDRFNMERLKALLVEQSQAQSLLVVDRLDFLLDTWRRSERQAFYRLIQNQWDGFRDSTKAKLMIALQTSSEVDALNITDSQGKSRIFRLTDFNDIA